MKWGYAIDLDDLKSCKEFLNIFSEKYWFSPIENSALLELIGNNYSRVHYLEYKMVGRSEKAKLRRFLKKNRLIEKEPQIA
jgi:hypothetical protein